MRGSYRKITVAVFVLLIASSASWLAALEQWAVLAAIVVLLLTTALAAGAWSVVIVRRNDARLRAVVGLLREAMTDAGLARIATQMAENTAQLQTLDERVDALTETIAAELTDAQWLSAVLQGISDTLQELAEAQAERGHDGG